MSLISRRFWIVRTASAFLLFGAGFLFLGALIQSGGEDAVPRTQGELWAWLAPPCIASISAVVAVAGPRARPHISVIAVVVSAAAVLAWSVFWMGQ